MCTGVAADAAQARDVDLVIANGIVVTMDAERRVLSPGSVAIRGNAIVGVGAADRIAREFKGRDTIDARGRVVMPGLINTHTHAPMVLYRGLGDDLALMDWLQKYIFPAEAKTVSPAFVRTGTRLAALEMIRSGTTTYVDMYYFEEEIARATREAGLRGVLGQTIIEFPVPDAKTPADALGARRSVHPRVPEGRADHAGGGAARRVHQRRRDPDRVAGPGGEVRRAAGHPPGRNRSRNAAVAGAPQGAPGGRARQRWASGRPRVIAAHGVWIEPGRSRGCCSSAASASRTTPKAT